MQRHPPQVLVDQFRQRAPGVEVVGGEDVRGHRDLRPVVGQHAGHGVVLAERERAVRLARTAGHPSGAGCPAKTT
jgi:hypothetical protein